MVSTTSEFEWSRYIKLAQNLDMQAGDVEDPQDQEALFRAAISRAYYGAFCLARNRLKVEANVVAKCLRGHRSDAVCLGDHGCVANYYGMSPDSTWQMIGQNLRNMMSNRKMADYEDRSRLRLSDISRTQVWAAQDTERALQNIP